MLTSTKILKIKKDKLELLKAMLEEVEISLENAKIDPDIESDVADVITDMIDKKKVKYLKVIREELTGWIEDVEKGNNPF